MPSIACCGLDCGACGAFIATKNNDNALRIKVAEDWSKTYNSDIKPEDINCAGCMLPGVKFRYCADICEIRKCGVARKVKNCACCEHYPCAKLDGFFKQVPDAKKNLEAQRE